MSSSKNYSAWNVSPLPRNAYAPKQKLYEHILSWGILAPSTHNVQPWRFALDAAGDKILARLEPSAILSTSDPLGREAVVSLGCSLEIISLLAAYYGLEVRFQFAEAERPPFPNPLTTINLLQGEKKFASIDESWLNAIKSRRMNRAKYDGRPVPEAVLEEIRKSVTEEGLVLDFIEDIPTRLAISEIQYLADRAVIALPRFRKELAGYLLPNDTQSFVGMPGNTFGLNDILAREMHEGLKADGLFNPDWAVGFGIAGRDGIKSSPIVAVISAIEDSPFFWLRAGMAFMRIALIAERAGLNIAVHAQMVEVETMNKLLKLRLGRKERPTVIFRLGYSTEKRPHAPRLLPQNVIEQI